MTRLVIAVAVVVILALMLTVPVSHAQILPTPTPTPTATPSPTPSPTPTPSWWETAHLSDGSQVVVERRFTYGELTIALLLAMTLIVLGIYATFQIITRYL